MLIAVEGCCHGELDKIYETLDYIANEHGKKVDLLICCGDFQAVRNVYDLSCMAVPPKYLSMQTFHKYYCGEKQAPVLTLFIGGNHEASNHLQELSYGGWVAPNIYYLGNAGVVDFGGHRIAGISGIYKGHDYLKGHHEVPPYNENTKRSVYHVRQLEVFRLKQIANPIDIFVSHDWPVGVTNHGDVDSLLRFKPFFHEDISRNCLGNPCLWDLLKKLKPSYWFSGHLHCKFAATIPHDNHAPTKFLALDKCVPHKRFLQILDVPHKGPLELSFDPEWLGIIRDTNHLLHLENSIHYLPGPGGQDRYDFAQSPDLIQETKREFGDLKIDPGTFQRTAPCHEVSFGEGTLSQITQHMKRYNIPLPPVKSYINPQTTWLCQKMALTDSLAKLLDVTQKKPQVDGFAGLSGGPNSGAQVGESNPDEIDLGPVETATNADDRDESQSETATKRLKLNDEVGST